MHFHRTISINDPTRVEALGAMLLVAPTFASYTHHGADNSPVMFELYKSAKPEYNERPIATATRGDDGEFTVTELAKSAAKGKS